MRNFRINIEHADEFVHEKIEKRNTNLYRTKMDYVLAAIRNFESSGSIHSEENCVCDIEKRVDQLEKDLASLQKEVQGNQKQESENDTFGFDNLLG